MVGCCFAHNQQLCYLRWDIVLAEQMAAYACVAQAGQRTHVSLQAPLDQAPIAHAYTSGLLTAGSLLLQWSLVISRLLRPHLCASRLNTKTSSLKLLLCCFGALR